MVFLKPSILRDFTDSAIVTNEKYNYLRAEQIRDEDEDFGLIKGAPVLPPLEPEHAEQAGTNPQAAGGATTETQPTEPSKPAEEEWHWDDEDDDFF
jgi:hypothetical protein